MSITTLKKSCLVTSSLSHGRIDIDSSSGITIDNTIKFKTPYSFCQMGSGSTFKIKYLAERWHWFNKELFGNTMELPNLVVAKAFKHPKVLGFWQPQTKTLSIAHKMLMLPSDKQVLGTLVHEMAHQYDSEILQTPLRDRMIKRGHGPSWDGVMRAIGMPADDKFAGDSMELMDEDEKEIIEIRRGTKEVEAANRITPESFGDEPYLFVMYLTVKGVSEPAILVNAPVSDAPNSSYRAFTKKDLKNNDCRYIALTNCIKPTAMQLRKFPAEFKTLHALKIVQELYDRCNWRKS